MNQTLKKRKPQSTIVRLFSHLKGQRIRLSVVAVSIVIYVGLSIYTPMYSALVIDHLWQSVQAAWSNGTTVPSRSRSTIWSSQPPLVCWTASYISRSIPWSWRFKVRGER